MRFIMKSNDLWCINYYVNVLLTESTGKRACYFIFYENRTEYSIWTWYNFYLYLYKTYNMAIHYFSLIEALFYCLIFVAVILLTESIIDYQKISGSPHKSKIKITILLITTTILTLSVYTTHCHQEIGFL